MYRIQFISCWWRTSRQRDEREKNELMAKNAQAILDTQVLLVPSRCDLTIPKELYDKFIADGASPNQPSSC